MNGPETPSPPPPTPRGTRRVDAARHLLKPHQFRESMAVSPQPSLRNAALVGVQTSLAAALVLPFMHLSPWPQLIGYAALGTLVGLFGRFAPQARRGRIVLMAALLQVATIFFMSMAAWLGLPVVGQLILLSIGAGLLFFAATTGQFGPPGALIFIFAASACIGQVDAGMVVLERTAATAAAAALTLLICLLTERLRHHGTDAAPLPVEQLRPVGHRIIAAARMAMGAGVATLLAHAAGMAHPAWAGMGAVAVMQGTHLHVSMNRALQRMAGTILGAMLVWLILVQTPSVWTVIALLIVIQIATEVVIGTNYAFGQILVTPMALLMSYLAAPGVAGAAMAPERVVDTLIGAVIGIAFAVLFSTLDDRAHLAHHHARRSGDPRNDDGETR